MKKSKPSNPNENCDTYDPNNGTWSESIAANDLNLDTDDSIAENLEQHVKI